MTTVAVVQPYFLPYAGYFRLFAAADTVVLFDCVQFPRRGWVHRNMFRTSTGKSDWLTLPIQKCDRDARIADLCFVVGASARLATAMRRFPLLEKAREGGSPLIDLVAQLGAGSVTEYLCAQLEAISALLGMARPIVRSSSLDIAPHVRRQARVVAIVEALGATRYVNPSGGRGLYAHDAFQERGIELGFLSDYTGSRESILTRLLTQSLPDIVGEIRRETVVTP